MLTTKFFNRDAVIVAKDLLGKVLRVKHREVWLSAMIIETEAYFLDDKASHASLGYTKKRKALFMQAGTIYMYYARGGDSLNVSCLGEGNAVLIKAAIPYFDKKSSKNTLKTLQKLNPTRDQGVRLLQKLCCGQTLLCKSLGLKVSDWDQKQFNRKCFYIEDCNYRSQQVIQTTRLGIPKGRDGHLWYRFIDLANADFCTSNPLRSRILRCGKHYKILQWT